MMSSFAVVLFDGLAYGILLFLISLGLSVTLGLMNFINLAHGAFAMIGGYIAAICMSRLGVPFLATLPLAFLGAAAVGLVLEATLYRRLYGASHLDQVLFTIGLTFIMVAAASYVFGPSQQPVRLPAFLTGQTAILGIEVSGYRLFLIGCGVLLTVGLGALFTRTRFGARIRAAVENQRVAGALGIHVDRVFSAAFVLGSGLVGWRARHRRARARSDVSAQVSGLFSDRGRGRRCRHHHRAALCGTADRRGRCRRQVLLSADRRLYHLRGDDCDPNIAAGGAGRRAG